MNKPVPYLPIKLQMVGLTQFMDLSAIVPIQNTSVVPMDREEMKQSKVGGEPKQCQAHMTQCVQSMLTFLWTILLKGQKQAVNERTFGLVVLLGEEHLRCGLRLDKSCRKDWIG